MGKGDREVRALEQRLKLTERPPADDTTKVELQHLTERFTALPKGIATTLASSK